MGLRAVERVYDYSLTEGAQYRVVMRCDRSPDTIMKV
jgi:hypothetical protein